MTIKVGINGFGRIGRSVLRGYLYKRANNEDLDYEIVAVNDYRPIKVKDSRGIGKLEIYYYLFKYDTAYGTYPGTMEADEESITIDGHRISFVAHSDPKDIPWDELGVDIVIDCTGVFTNEESLSHHIEAGAKKVILTANGKDFKNIVMGVNSDSYNPEEDHIIGNSSCTTNCLAPLTKIIDENFGIKQGLMITIHAYTNDQNLTDNKHPDMRRARAAAQNIIPTTTGAAKAVGEVYPPVNGKMNGYAVRVPVITGSLTDVTFNLEGEYTKEEINAAVKKASENEFKGIMGYTEDPIVSSDIQGKEHSSIFDASLTLVNGDQVKLVAWYDNEWAYTQRALDLAELVASKM